MNKDIQEEIERLLVKEDVIKDFKIFSKQLNFEEAIREKNIDKLYQICAQFILDEQTLKMILFMLLPAESIIRLLFRDNHYFDKAFLSNIFMKNEIAQSLNESKPHFIKELVKKNNMDFGLVGNSSEEASVSGCKNNEKFSEKLPYNEIQQANTSLLSSETFKIDSLISQNSSLIKQTNSTCSCSHPLSQQMTNYSPVVFSSASQLTEEFEFVEFPMFYPFKIRPEKCSLCVVPQNKEESLGVSILKENPLQPGLVWKNSQTHMAYITTVCFYFIFLFYFFF
jgi:hypothetical protein